MKKLYKIFPEVQVCKSNHGDRVYRKSFDAGLPIDLVKSPKEIWEAPKGWSWHDRILIDDVIYIHGDPKCGQRAAFSWMRELHKSVVIGHTHAWGGVQYVSTPYERNFFALNVGCLIDETQRAYMYSKKLAVKSTLGIGMVFGGKDAQFLPMPL